MRRLAFVLALLITLSLACTKSKVARDSATLRVVSLSPSTTEALFAVGAGDKLVGRSRYCDFPADVTKLPQVGGFVDPNLEAILALRPTLVIGARGPAGSAIADTLTTRSIDTYFPPTESFDAIDAMIIGVGERAGRRDAAHTAVDALHAQIAEVERTVAPLPKTRVLVIFGLEPLSVAGPSSFADEMVRRAGGQNVVTEGGAYPTIGIERAIALDPDLVINAAMMEERAAERLRSDAWSRVRAIRIGRVTTITSEAVLRPGPRIAEGLSLFAQALHPEAHFANVTR